ncbi:hypothetical protein GH714_028015 [Hevea brasiliensis]|uniref:Protein kinase domain-containing protein n=1 Tax=Hevea brasiliensis TaxID=3981 RepID=A0A6A6LWV5_HEVBR|nr:hypothetical protein GH714_028015 [Hevea brasiliensis]
MLEKENLDEGVLPVSAHGSSKRLSSENSRKGSVSSRRPSHQSRPAMGDLIMINDEKGSFGLPDLMKAAAEVLGNGGLGKEEKLMVSEHMPKGSLLYVLHGDRGICHAELNWATRLKIIKGIASGLGFLYSEYPTYNLPHGNLKSSNVLLSETYEPLLCDYALDPLTNPNHSAEAMFAYKSPEYIEKRQVSPKSDVYCFGIIILEVVTGKFPSQYLSNNISNAMEGQMLYNGYSKQHRKGKSKN